MNTKLAEHPMSHKVYDRSTLGSDATVFSLVAAIGSAFAGGALASAPSHAAHGPDVSARVAALVRQIDRCDPTLARDLGAERKIVQWRN
jgi:hypothetical protein